jgi:hypothetical protein
MSEENKYLKDLLNTLNSKFKIWILPLSQEEEDELLKELRKIIGEENWEEYLRKQKELNKLIEESKKR